MRLKLTRSGGLLGSPLPPVSLDTTTLDPARKEHLESLVQAAAFFALPSTLAADRPGPDRFQFDLEVEDPTHGRRHRVRFGEESAPEPLLLLASALRRAG